MKDQTLTDKNGALLSSSTDKGVNEKNADRTLTSERTASANEIAKSANSSANSATRSPKSKFTLLPARIFSNAIATAILLFGVSFAGTFFIALAILRLAQPQTNRPTSTNLVAPTVTPNQSNPNRPRSLVNQIISLVSFGYVSGVPEAQDVKISKNSLPGMTLGKSWTSDTAFSPATSLSAPPPLAGQPLQTISPSQLPPISFSIPPDAIPDALVPPPDSTDATNTPNRPAIAKGKKPAPSTRSSQETVIDLPKDTLGKTLTSGASTRATLVNAAVFSGDRNASSSPRFVVRLDEPLKNPSGKLVLPANTTLVTIVRTLSSKGEAELEAVNVLIDGKEYDLPAGAIKFLDTNGSSLIGQKYGDEEPTNSSKETTNSAKESNNVNPLDSDNPNNTETTPSASQPSPEQVKDRNKEAIENVMRRSQFYYIPQGTPLKLVVNKTVKL